MANNRASLMNVGREVDYAVRALSYMAVASRSGVPTRRAEIGQAQAIPRHYLAKILRKAVDGGLVESGVGPRGGFWLARDPASISLRDVYECINGPMCQPQNYRQNVYGANSDFVGGGVGLLCMKSN